MKWVYGEKTAMAMERRLEEGRKKREVEGACEGGMALIYLQDVRCNLLDIVDGPKMVAHVLVLVLVLVGISRAPASTPWVAARAVAGFSVQRSSA